jgi:hypothetical protein
LMCVYVYAYVLRLFEHVVAPAVRRCSQIVYWTSFIGFDRWAVIRGIVS